MGASVVNALSIFCEVVVHRDGGVFVQEYKQGKRKAAVKKVGKSELHGTIVTFEPDPAIFPEIAFDWNNIVAHLRQQAYLVRGMRVTIIDAREQFYQAVEALPYGGDDREYYQAVRMTIGRVFIVVFKSNLLPKEKDAFLVQGTSQADVVESMTGRKAHHHVGGVPENIEMDVMEPLAGLYQSEIRTLAE